MFYTESVTLSTCGIQFQLPTGFLLLESEEPHVNSTLTLRAPDGSYLISISTDRSAKSSGDELRSILSEGGYHVLSPITPYSQNGLSGHSAAYLSGRRGYWELRIDLPNSVPGSAAPNTLVIQLSTHWGRSLQSFCGSPDVALLLQSLRTVSE